MYAFDLSAVSTDDFGATILEIDMIPSRRVLKTHISEIVASLHRHDIDDLEALRRLLKDKRGYSELATGLGVDEQYLTLLNREVNSYVTKPLPLARLERLFEEELERLATASVTSTRHLYERCATKSGREALANETRIAFERLTGVLGLCDLVRITGCGPASARAFWDLGIRGPRDYLATDSETIQRRYADYTEKETGRREVLGLVDIDYCRRYCEGLSDDIER